MLDIKFIKKVVFINSLVPFILLSWDAYHKKLGANPLEFITHTTGMLALIFLLLSLTVTPVRKVLGLAWIVKLRRLLGLYAFFYGCLHFMTYAWFDKFFHLKTIVQDTMKRPFIALGMLSFLVMVPLAITSTNAMIKYLGSKKWNQLHKITYIAAIAGVLHYWVLVKADIRLPLAFATALTILLGYRWFNKFAPHLTERGKTKVETIVKLGIND